jgi:hypothetical protein
LPARLQLWPLGPLTTVLATSSPGDGSTTSAVVKKVTPERWNGSGVMPMPNPAKAAMLTWPILANAPLHVSRTEPSR